MKRETLLIQSQGLLSFDPPSPVFESLSGCMHYLLDMIFHFLCSTACLAGGLGHTIFTIYVCVFVCICTYMYIHMYIYITHVYITIWMCVCICICSQWLQRVGHDLATERQ